MAENTPSINLVAVGILIGVLQTLILLYVTFLKKGHASLKYFGLFLIAVLIAQIESFLNRSGLMARIPHLLNIATPFVLLFGPLLLFYIKSWVNKPMTLRQLFLHSLPFVLFLGYSFFFYLQPPDYKYNAYVNSFGSLMPLREFEQTFDSDPWNIRGIVVVELLSIHILIYATLVFYEVKKVRTQQPKTDLSFPLFTGFILATGALILWMSQGGIINGNRFISNLIPSFSADLFPTIAIYAVSLFILKNGFPLGMKNPKYYKSGIGKELLSSRGQKIKVLIEENKLFAKPDFSLQSLSTAANLSTHHISQVLNEEMGCTFFELTHHYRIEEAKKRLKEKQSQVKMEQLAYELGYRSKSTFFSAFKKATNLTPLKYQESHNP